MKRSKTVELNYKEDVEIDVASLDVEWLNQAALAIKYGRHLVNMKSKVRKLQERKKTVRSELILDANEDSEGTIGKKRPNANDIEAYYRQHEKYIAVVDELNEAIEEMEFAEIAKNEIAFTRKATLENLVKLHGMNYFAGPSVPHDLKEIQQARQTKVNQKIKSKMKQQEKRAKTL
jgi:hypothetical protein